MLFQSYAALQAEVESRLNRPVDSIETWLREAEGWLNHGHEAYRSMSPALRVDSLEVVRNYQQVLDGNTLMVPDDFQLMREARGHIYGTEVVLKYLTPFQFTNIRDLDTGYTVRAGKMYLTDQVGAPVTLHYYQKIPDLNAQNYPGHPVVMLDDAVYLYGVLAAAHHRYRNEEQAAWEFRHFASAVRRLNRETQRARSGDSPMLVTVPGGVV